jgi:3-oxoacyl-[acyl-carrier-protein] synthase II
MTEKRVVITGLGIISAVGLTVESFWKSNLEGRCGVGLIEGFPTEEYATRIAAEIRDFDPSPWLDRKEARRIDRYAQFAIAASDMALADAGLKEGNVDPNRVGVILGSGIGGLREIDAQYDKLHAKGPGRVSPFFVPKMMINAAPGLVAIRHGYKGPNFAAVSACAASTHAAGVAWDMIQAGRADVFITGGSEAAITPMGLAAFTNMRALSRRNDEPEKASRPFDKERDGFVMGEGAGVVVMESLEHARRRGARIYVEVMGFGMTDDCYHITAPDPEGEGAMRCMALALESGGLAPEEVDYINAHGTSTPHNDVVETRAIKRLFGEHAYRLCVSSTKSMIGHLLGGSGGAEMVATVLAMKDQVVPPTMNYETPDPECDLDYVPNEAREREVRVAISNSFGFGGHNATVALKRLE